MKTIILRVAFALTLAVSVTLVGCQQDPVAKHSTNNPDIQVETLFDYDGCRAYRFNDGGRTIYFTRCGSATNTAWYESSGKTTVYREVHTENR